MTYATLDEWLDEIENFATRRERLLEHCNYPILPWLETAWRLGKESGVRHGRMNTQVNGCVCTFDEEGNGPTDVCTAHQEWAAIKLESLETGLLKIREIALAKAVKESEVATINEIAKEAFAKGREG